jgi:hypothetical protein
MRRKWTVFIRALSDSFRNDVFADVHGHLEHRSSTEADAQKSDWPSAPSKDAGVWKAAWGWLEPGTHRWEQFVTPLELTGFARAAGLRRQSLRGMVYDPFRRDWRLSSDTAVNYLFAATKADA